MARSPCSYKHISRGYHRVLVVHQMDTQKCTLTVKKGHNNFAMATRHGPFFKRHAKCSLPKLCLDVSMEEKNNEILSPPQHRWARLCIQTQQIIL